METKMYEEYLVYCTKRIEDNSNGHLKHLDYNHRGVVYYNVEEFEEVGGEERRDDLHFLR